MEALSVEELVERHHALEKRFKELADGIGREVHEKALEIMAGARAAATLGSLYWRRLRNSTVRTGRRSKRWPG